MKKLLFIAAFGLAGAAGCESPSTVRPADASPGVQSSADAEPSPRDGRNLAPGLQQYGDRDPSFPNDVATGGGGGKR